ncbi:nitroreductase family protein [Deinococcus radiophilus]|uniref:Nitroreductase family protein n=1 Tax=Deinococcus radiophilus TaxID=32062 RepID=A0A3S0IJZ2_9DEIO|nr:nitroreductase family protein [Deinococcus radiophilus]RTR25711.1 nitroreductase family protein [Deinococcus radiophilus]UFA50217.1 nitroreductase family protein [Deinococcus radiophilus]
MTNVALPETDQAQAITDIIESRRSIRRFESGPIPEADLREMLRLAGLAPSAWNAQTWRFVVVQDPALKEQLQAAAYGQPQVTNAPAVIVVYSDMEDTLQTAEDTAHPGMGEAGRSQQRQTFDGAFGAQDVAQRGQWGLAQANIAFGFLMLAVRGLGYDGVPMLGFDPAKVRELLDLPEHVQFAGIYPVGKRAEEGFSHHRHSVDRVTTWK